jgi:hypothetical protein
VRRAAAVLLAALAALGCRADPTPTDDGRCPCATGRTCCPPINRCVAPDQAAPLGCFGPIDAPPPASDAPGSARDAAADAETDAAAEPDLPTDSAGASPDQAADRAADLAAPSPDATGAACENGGGGLRATYWDNADFTGPSVTVLEPSLNLDWSTTGPHPAIANTTFSAVFTGQIQPETTDRYTFVLRADDGVRLWIGGELVIDWWRPHYMYDLAATIALEGGRRYDIRIEYFNAFEGAILRLSWKTASTSRAEIPQCRLFPGAAGPPACPAEIGDCLPPGTPSCAAPGEGLAGQYFDNPDFTGAVVNHADDSISFQWDGQPPVSGMDGLAFSARWTGRLEVPATGRYTFYLMAEATARLRIDDVLVVDATGGRPGWEVEGEIPLTAGRHAVSVEYRKTNLWGFLKLRWKSDALPRSVIPKCRFTPGP